MTCLLVLAHPVADSLNQHLSQVAEQAAQEAGLRVQRLDLYAAGFDPRLSAAERSAYYSAPEDMAEPQLANYAEMLQDAEVLILVFPTWWFGFPAILKGWFDRVWRPGIAFDHAADMGRIHPRLRQLRHTIAITTMGSPRWIDYLLLRQPLRRVMRWSILKPCAANCRLHWLALHSAETASAQRVEIFANRIRKAIIEATNAA